MVYDYSLQNIGGIDYITDFMELPEQGNQLFNNPVPGIKFIGPGWQYDSFGNLQWALIDNQIVHMPQEPTEAQISLQGFKRIDLFRVIKGLVNGIDTGGTGTKYNNLKAIMDKIQNGL